MKYISCLLLLFFTLDSNAADICAEKQQFRIEYSRCLDQQIETMQRDLTTWENNHLIQLQEIAEKTGRTDPLKVFKRSRQSFQQHSTDHCRLQYLALIPDSDAGASAYKKCMINQLEQQIDILSKITY